MDLARHKMRSPIYRMRTPARTELLLLQEYLRHGGRFVNIVLLKTRVKKRNVRAELNFLLRNTFLKG